MKLKLTEDGWDEDSERVYSRMRRHHHLDMGFHLQRQEASKLPRVFFLSVRLPAAMSTSLGTGKYNRDVLQLLYEAVAG